MYERKLIFESDDFRLLFCQAAHFSTKDQPYVNKKRFLIADVFDFVDLDV